VKDFVDFSRKYLEHIEKMDYKTAPLIKERIDTVDSGFNRIKVFRAFHRSNDGETVLNHILVEM